MLKRYPEFFVVDILVAIDKIKRKVAHLSFEQFVSDEDIVDVAMRNLEVIGEATSQLLKHPHFLEKTDIEWRRIVDFRNVLIHFYFGVDLELVFNEIVQKKVPELEQELLKLMRNTKDASGFLNALKSAMVDLEKLHRNESVSYLKKIASQLE